MFLYFRMRILFGSCSRCRTAWPTPHSPWVGYSSSCVNSQAAGFLWMFLSVGIYDFIFIDLFPCRSLFLGMENRSLLCQFVLFKKNRGLRLGFPRTLMFSVQIHYTNRFWSWVKISFCNLLGHFIRALYMTESKKLQVRSLSK